MNQPVVNTANTLNRASYEPPRTRSAYSGADFAAVNALVDARPLGAQGDQGPNSAINVAQADAFRLLNELNHVRRAPDIATVAAINAVVSAHETDQHEQSHAEHHEELTRQAQKLVSHTFFGPMLRQMRNSPFKSDLFEGGRGGQVFHSLFDQHLADRMAGSTNNKLVSAIVRRLEQRGQPAPRPANPYENVRVHVAPGFGS